ncbi:hypothetical protein K474DRAFT_1350434 [Panus rudis PR-1116 ss-1]|nr:hypothetical protein K474DRAFT_1350434 [Panus rudis PR-1116 ss-1]
MKLQVSKSSSTTNVFLSRSDLGDLTPLYYIHTPGFFNVKTSFIYKIAPDVADRYRGRKDLKEDDLAGQEDMARINWHRMSSSQLVYNGAMVDIDDFMPIKEFWRGARTFQGPDGRAYVWNESLAACHLDLDDGSKHPVKVAKFKQRNILKGRRACLEIFPAGEHMVDLIVITWLYYETRRRDKEQQSATISIAATNAAASTD